MKNVLTLTLHGTDDLPFVAEQILESIRGCEIVAFYGGMGAGKTTLIREICTLLGVTDNVNSPTFAIVNEYATDASDTIYHFDFYRINSEAELFDLGYEEYFSSGNLCLIEWPEKIGNMLPLGTARVDISVGGDQSRTITVNI